MTNINDSDSWIAMRMFVYTFIKTGARAIYSKPCKTVCIDAQHFLVKIWRCGLAIKPLTGRYKERAHCLHSEGYQHQRLKRETKKIQGLNTCWVWWAVSLNKLYHVNTLLYCSEYCNINKQKLRYWKMPKLPNHCLSNNVNMNYTVVIGLQ